MLVDNLIDITNDFRGLRSWTFEPDEDDMTPTDEGTETPDEARPKTVFAVLFFPHKGKGATSLSGRRFETRDEAEGYAGRFQGTWPETVKGYRVLEFESDR